jgi:ABC-type multidrug transport system fused ATPase/permease subunit
VVLEAGRIVDVGTHAELLARCRLYRDLVGSSEQPAP